jgi:hypothetical protein
MKYNIVFSINVYDNIKALDVLFRNLTEKVLSSYCIILNCNDYMFDILKDKNLDNNIYLNPHTINKKKHHGSLTKGIVSNMNFAINKFKFDYFVVLSQRNIFYKNVTSYDLTKLTKKWESIEQLKENRMKKFTSTDWFWPSMKNTLLAKYYLKKEYYLNNSEHEGLCFSYNVVNTILNFFDNNKEIANDLFNFNHCVEEFALQTIALNETDLSNLEYGFLNIGHGIQLKFNIYKKNKYVRKIII